MASVDPWMQIKNEHNLFQRFMTSSYYMSPTYLDSENIFELIFYKKNKTRDYKYIIKFSNSRYKFSVFLIFLTYIY